MQIYSEDIKGPLSIPGYLDPTDVTNVEVFWGAPAFVANAIYKLGDITRPTVDNGYYYTCITTGKAGLEPVWAGKKVTSGEAKFSSVSYNLPVGPAETITASAWEYTNGITLTSPTFDTVRTGVTISAVPLDVTTFTLINQITVGGQKLTKSFIYKVNNVTGTLLT